MRATTYYLKRGTKPCGPFSLTHIRRLLKEHRLKANDVIAESKDGPWKRVAEVYKTIGAENGNGNDDLWLDRLSKLESTGSTIGTVKWDCSACGLFVLVTDEDKEPEVCADCGGALKPHRSKAHQLADMKAKQQRKQQRTQWDVVRRGLEMMHVSASIYFYLLMLSIAVISAGVGLYFFENIGGRIYGYFDANGEFHFIWWVVAIKIGYVCFVITVIPLLLMLVHVSAEEYFWDVCGYFAACLFFVMCLNIYPGIVEPTLVVAAALALVASLGVFLGFSMCCFVPRGSGAHIWMVFATVFLMSSVFTSVGSLVVAVQKMAAGNLLEAMKIPLAVYLTVGSQILGCVAHFCFALFLQAVGNEFHEKHLPEIVRQYFVLQFALAILYVIAASVVVRQDAEPRFIILVLFLAALLAVYATAYFTYLVRATRDCIES